MNSDPLTPDLWAQPQPAALPSQSVATQRAAARRVNPLILTLRETVLVCVARAPWRAADSGLLLRGMNAKEVSQATGIELVTTRARLTELHTAGHVIRTQQTRDRQYLYCTPEHYAPAYGIEPSRKHGRTV